MARSSLMLIAALAVGSFLTQSAAGQFTLPKIKIPKITKTETPKTPNSPEPDTDSLDPKTGKPKSPVKSVYVHGIEIPGAKITFSNNPDGSNPKTSFTSSEFIYGRLDLGGKTVYDVFGLKNFGDAGFYYLDFDLQIWKPDQEPYDKWQGKSPTLVTKEDAKKTYWNFDVLPEPSKSSTLRGVQGAQNELQYYSGRASMYPYVGDEETASTTFPKSGTYSVAITVTGQSYDDWGKPTFEREEYPTAYAAFAFQFNIADGRTLVANAKKAEDAMTSARNRREMFHALPDWWAKGARPPEAKLAPARLVPMIKDYIGQWNMTYLKHMIYPISGPVWAVEKNELGIPRYRRFTSAIYIIYRDPTDNSCQLGYLEMHEPYAGGGTYSGPALSGISEVKYIDCAVVK